MSRTESLNDTDARAVAAAEAELDRLLAVEPSVEFVAKVRARIAAEPSPRGWPWRRLVLALATASALMIVFTLRNGLHTSEGDGSPKNPPHQDIVLDSAPVVGGAPVASNRPAVIPGRRTVRPAALRVANAPEIIIDPSLAAAIRRLALSSAYTSLDVNPTGAETIAGEPAALSIADPLDVPELVLKPADQSGGQ